MSPVFCNDGNDHHDASDDFNDDDHHENDIDGVTLHTRSHESLGQYVGPIVRQPLHFSLNVQMYIFSLLTMLSS